MSLREPQCHDDLVNFRIKRLLMLGSAPAVRICEGEFGLPRFEWRLLAALVEHGETSPTQLAAAAGVERARASRALSSLAEKRLIVRLAHPTDMRRATVRATGDGVRLYRRLFPRLAEVNVRLLAALDDQELDALECCLRKLTANAERILSDRPRSNQKTPRRLGGSRRVWAEQAAARARSALPAS